ncbi:MAG: PAS domain S-box protein, partial [Halobacteriaceae archaeon]
MNTKRVFFVSLVIIAVVFSGAIVLGFQQYKQTLYTHEKSELNHAAVHVQSNLNNQLQALERTVSVAAANPALTRHGTDAQREALQTLVNRSAFAGASVIAANGTMTNIVANVSTERRHQLVGSQFNDRMYFQQAMAGQTYISTPFKAASGNYIITVSTPLRRNGEIVGTVNAAFHLSETTFFAEVASMLSQRQGFTIYAQDGTVIYENSPSPRTELLVRNATVATTGWTVSVQESRTPLQATIQTVTYVQIGALVVLLGSLGGLGWLVYRRNISQLDQLLDGFAALANEEYGTQITLDGTGEWNRIETAFNEVSQTLETAITQREQQKQEIEEERQKYTTLVEQSQDGIAIVQDAEFVFVNEALTELIGAPEDELLGGSVSEIMAPDYRDLVRKRHEKRVEGENPPQRYDVEVLTTDDEHRHIDLKIARIQYDGEPAFLATFTDVTERKQREQQLRQFQEAVEQAAHAIYITDSDGTIQYVNPAFEDITGYNAETVVGETPAVLQSGEHDDAFYDDLWDTITNGAEWHHEMRDETKQGEEIILDQTISPIETDEGEIDAFVAVSRDITKRKAREQSLER